VPFQLLTHRADYQGNRGTYFPLFPSFLTSLLLIALRANLQTPIHILRVSGGRAAGFYRAYPDGVSE
jgi:hypothetical protein